VNDGIVRASEAALFFLSLRFTFHAERAARVVLDENELARGEGGGGTVFDPASGCRALPPVESFFAVG